MPEDRPADTALGARTIGTLDEFGGVGEGPLNPADAGGADLLNLTSITTLPDRWESWR